MHARRARLRTAALLLIVTAAVLAQSWALPALEGGDEVLHLNYVDRLLAGEGLPDRATAATNATQQASGQPPLAYLLYAAWGRLLGAAQLNGDAVLDYALAQRNPWHFPHDPWASGDNHSIYVHGVDDRTGVTEAAFGWPELVAHNQALRLAGLLWALLGAEAALWAGRELFRREAWALTASLLFALMPTSVYLAATVTNDGAAAALGAWATWAMLRTLRHGATLRLSLLMGLLVSLAALAKVSALLLGPAATLAILLAPNAPDWRREPARWLRRAVAHGLALAVPVVLLFGPWVAWGWLNSGDPFGLNTHQFQTAGLYFAEPQSFAAVVARLPQTAWTYFAQFNTVQLGVTTSALLAVPLLAIAGALAAQRRSATSPFALRAALVLGLIFMLTLVALLRWMGQFAITGGRLMYPAHAAIILALTAGLYALWRRWPRLGRAAQAYAVVVVTVSGAVLGPLAIRSAFAAPSRLSETALPVLTGPPTDYAETGADSPFLRLLGAAFPAGERIAGDTLPLTLCWEALAQPSREPAFSAKLIADGEIAADRTSLFGLGRYPSVLWQPGDIWCDTFDLWIDDPDLADEPPLRLGLRYDLVITVLDAETQASDFVRTQAGVPVDAVIMGSAVSPAGQMPVDAMTAADIAFPGFARLTGYRVDGSLSAGASPALTLVFAVDRAIPESLASFVHLYRGDAFVAVLADGVPRAGRYPTTDWQPGEQVVDSWTLVLPADLPAGDYSIRVGLYDPITGARRPVTAQNSPAPEASAPLLAFTAR